MKKTIARARKLKASPKRVQVNRSIFARLRPFYPASLSPQRFYIQPWAGPLTTVVSPDPSNPNDVFDYAWGAQDQLILKVIFSNPVNPSTVVPTSTLILRTSQDQNANGTLMWNSDHTAFTFITTKTTDKLLFPHPDDHFILVLTGIRDEFGLLIDGDYDGREGGDYEMFFTIIG